MQSVVRVGLLWCLTCYTLSAQDWTYQIGPVLNTPKNSELRAVLPVLDPEGHFFLWRTRGVSKHLLEQYGPGGELEKAREIQFSKNEDLLNILPLGNGLELIVEEKKRIRFWYYPLVASR